MPPLITLTENCKFSLTKRIQNESISETPGAQLHMLTYNPVKIHDCRSNTFGATCDNIRDGRPEGWTSCYARRLKPREKHSIIKGMYLSVKYYFYVLTFQN